VFRRQPGLVLTDVDIRRLVDQASAGALSVDESSTLADIVGRQREGPGTLVALFGALATVSLILATTGIYASMSQSLARRRRSFAIRLALGASPSSMASLAVVRDGVLVMAGTGAGAIVTLAITKTVWPEAFLVAGTDWRFWCGACTAIAVVGVSASIGPVWRAIHLDPMSILQRTDA
jgi:putative ABC transport system permease protein